MLLESPVRARRIAGRLGAIVLTALVLVRAQIGPPIPPRPTGPGGPRHANRVVETRRKLDSARAVDVTAQRALEYSREILSSAESALGSNQSFAADRFAEAADALIHVAEYQQHLRKQGSPKEQSFDAAVQDHLQRAYFRVQQADYFLVQSHDPRVRSFPQWARDFYQLAVRAVERKDFIAAEENAKSVEDIVKALESLAQAAIAGTTLPRAPKPPEPRGSQ